MTAEISRHAKVMDNLTGVLTILNALGTLIGFIVIGSAGEDAFGESEFDWPAALTFLIAGALLTVVTWAVLHSLTLLLKAAAPPAE